MAAALKLNTPGRPLAGDIEDGRRFMKQETEKPDGQDLPPPGRRPTTREVYQQKIAHNPTWRDTTTAGHGFIIGCATPSKESAN
jgi:hypothetical protein